LTGVGGGGDPPPDRADGYAPIEAYALIGDGRTVALVAADGRVDWWPSPTLDAPPVLAALLDAERGGYLGLAPSVPYRVSRGYRRATNVLETVYQTERGRVRVTSALNTGLSGPLPWTELAMRVEGLDGEVPLRFDLEPGDRLLSARPRTGRREGTPVMAVGDQNLAVVSGVPLDFSVGERSLQADLVARPGSRTVLAVVSTDREPLFLPAPDEVDARLDRTVASWRRWSGLLRCPGRWAEAVERSALALKSLVAESTGAIAAAATTSLPERISGPKNWDYRFAWVRDSAFALDALIRLGRHEEVHRSVSWLLGALRANGGKLKVLYTLAGQAAGEAVELDRPGYRASPPVRVGNSASNQLQLGGYGDLLDMLERYCRAGHLLDEGTGRLLAGLADRCCDEWQKRDSGIWELERTEHYTVSKIGCWVALDRAVRLAARGQIPGSTADRWVAERSRIRSWIEDRCWSDTKQAYSFYAGTDDLDAAVLLAARTGFDRGPRLRSTIAAIRAELGCGPWLYRYSGSDREEGAFVACSFWLVEALAHSGQIEPAETLMDQVVAGASPLGLYAEQVEPATGRFLGNIPQALSHLALVNAAFAVCEQAG
jgi:GH15 family glucan-1,4-alpha-glucosidase